MPILGYIVRDKLPREPQHSLYHLISSLHFYCDKAASSIYNRSVQIFFHTVYLAFPRLSTPSYPLLAVPIYAKQRANPFDAMIQAPIPQGNLAPTNSHGLAPPSTTTTTQC